MEKIAELHSVLMSYRNNGHSAEVLKFYEEVLETMKLAHLYMQQTKFIHQPKRPTGEQLQIFGPS